MKILVVNQPIRNRGDEAAHKAFMNLLSTLVDYKVEVLMGSDAKKEDINAYAEKYDNIKYTIQPEVKVWGDQFIPKMRAILPDILFYFLFFWHPLLRIRRKFIRYSDIVVCAPGGVCMGPYRSWNHIFNLQLALDLDKPLFIYGRSFGPLPDETREDKYFGKASKRILKKVRYISLRDKKSQTYAKKLGLDYQPTIDAAFAREKQVVLPRELSEIENREYVVFVPNELYSWHVNYKNVPKSKFDKLYTAILGDLEKQYHVVMLPQLYGRKDSDYKYFEYLKDISKSNNVSVIPDNYNSNVQQRIIAGAKLVVGVRYHSIIFAINNSTPFVALSYEHKMLNTLELLGIDDYALTLDEALSAHEQVLEKIKIIMSNYDKHRRRIKEARSEAIKIVKIGNETFIANLKQIR